LSLIEVLVVTACVVILIALLLPNSNCNIRGCLKA
jgi:type II secretory pathway pseudopilin PulG